MQLTIVVCLILAKCAIHHEQDNGEDSERCIRHSTEGKRQLP